MSIECWFLLMGALLLAIGFGSTILQRLPITTSIAYLLVGLVAGPSGFALFHFNPLKQSGLLEILTEVAVLISLFAAGVKMPTPFRFAIWDTPLRLASIGMFVTVFMVTIYGVTILGFPLGAAILLGAVLSPTDPVLATDVQIRHPGDDDALRFSLTSEAGMNDGTAFPFVMLGLGLLGLHDLGQWGTHWLIIEVVWATGAGILIGITGGYLLARVANQLRNKESNQPGLLNDFLGLGLISAVYGASLWANAWGFLAVFAAAVSLRQTESRLANAADESPGIQNEYLNSPSPKIGVVVSEAALVFKEHLERLSELVLILLLGGMLFWDSWSWKAILFCLYLFFIARPISVWIATLGTGQSSNCRLLLAWFGIRGIGSLYYLMFAIQHGLPEIYSLELIHITLVVIVISILVHGITVKPVLRYFSTHT